VWTTAIFWLLVLASVLIAAFVWHRLPEQRSFSYLVQWSFRLVAGAVRGAPWNDCDYRFHRFGRLELKDDLDHRLAPMQLTLDTQLTLITFRDKDVWSSLLAELQADDTAPAGHGGTLAEARANLVQNVRSLQRGLLDVGSIKSPSASARLGPLILRAKPSTQMEKVSSDLCLMKPTSRPLRSTFSNSATPPAPDSRTVWSVRNAQSSSTLPGGASLSSARSTAVLSGAGSLSKATSTSTPSVRSSIVQMAA